MLCGDRARRRKKPRAAPPSLTTPLSPLRALARSPLPFLALQTGKLATIVDIVDHNLALIDGPETITGVKRQVRPPPRLRAVCGGWGGRSSVAATSPFPSSRVLPLLSPLCLLLGR